MVPISTTEPRIPSPIHVQLPGEDMYRCFDGADRVWVKTDLIAHVRFERLDRVRIAARDDAGNVVPRKSVYIPTVSLQAEHIREVRKAILHSLGLGRLTDFV